MDVSEAMNEWWAEMNGRLVLVFCGDIYVEHGILW